MNIQACRVPEVNDIQVDIDDGTIDGLAFADSTLEILFIKLHLLVLSSKSPSRMIIGLLAVDTLLSL